MTAQLSLSADATAARTARRWVHDHLVAHSRQQLSGLAVLGVSELVTNSVLYVRGPIVVRIPSEDPLRIEVYDESPHPPHTRNRLVTVDEANPSTVGRGLQILDAISHAWGVRFEQAGKCVWFQPMSDGGLSRSISGPLTAQPEIIAGPPGREPLVEVTLRKVPVTLMMRYQTRFRDLRRELTLIALDRHDDSVVTDRLVDTALQLDDFRSYGEHSTRQIEDAARRGADRVDLRLEVPRTAIQTITQLRLRLREANDFCRRAELLSLEAGAQELAMREWYLGEIVAQAAGAEPTPWQGAFVVTDEVPGQSTPPQD